MPLISQKSVDLIYYYLLLSKLSSVEEERKKALGRAIVCHLRTALLTVRSLRVLSLEVCRHYGCN